MKWNKFRLKTTTEAEDIVSSMLMDLGIQGVEIEDKVPLTSQDKEQMFVDILPQMPEDDGTAFLTFYLEEEEDPAEMLGKVQKELEEMRTYVNVGECTIEESQTEDVDWVNNWKQYFHQFYIDDILVIPSWEQVEEKDKSKLVIHIDPGTVSRMMEPLLRNGFITQTQSPDDRRVNLIELTEKGRRAAVEWNEACSNAESLMLRGFSDDEVKAFIGVLSRVVDNLGGLSDE